MKQILPPEHIQVTARSVAKAKKQMEKTPGWKSANDYERKQYEHGVAVRDTLKLIKGDKT